jgi:hypothetical protein
MHRYLLWPALLIALTLTACGEKDDSRAVRRLIEKGTSLAQEHQIGDLMKLTTSDFSAKPGDHDARTVRGILLAAFKHYGHFEIHYPRPGVEVTAETSASAEVTFIIVSKDKPLPGLKDLYDDPGRWVEQAGEKADLYRLQLELIKKDGDWRVARARLGGFDGRSFQY